MMATALKHAPTVEKVLTDMDAERSFGTALVSALAEIGGASKDKTNPHFKSKYADLGSVIDAIKPVLARYGLAFTQHPQPNPEGVTVETFVHHVGGESRHLGSLFVPANKRDAQGFGSALTYARRYALMTAFGVPAEDDDGNAAASSYRQTAQEEHSDPKPTGKEKDGDYSPTALRGAIKTIVRNINATSTVRELDELLELDDAKDVIEQCQRRFPAWWETGEGCPSEFVPLKKLIEQTRQGLMQLEAAE